MSMSVKIHSEEKQPLLGRATAFFVYLFEKVMPDPFVFAVILTFVGALLALWFAPNATLPSVASAWYGGIFAIFAFAFQMVLMLVAGYALAMAHLCREALRESRHSSRHRWRQYRRRQHESYCNMAVGSVQGTFWPCHRHGTPSIVFSLRQREDGYCQ
jgi:membrane protein implicated in regulation of membrane protease activity